MLVQWKTLPESPMPAEGRTPPDPGRALPACSPASPSPAHSHPICTCGFWCWTQSLTPVSLLGQPSSPALPATAQDWEPSPMWAVGMPATERSSFTHLSSPRWTSQTMNLSMVTQTSAGTQLTHNTCWLRSELSNVYDARVLYRIQPL